VSNQNKGEKMSLVIQDILEDIRDNGLGTPDAALHSTQIVPAATPAQVGATGARRLMGVILFGGSADSQVEFKNAATDTGTVLLSLNCLAKTSTGVDLSSLGGLSFSTAIFCKPAGTGAICYVWYE
jgi:hypothetical protein